MNLVSVPFFTLPQVIVRSGVLSAMKPGELSLAVALYHEMERRSESAFTITNAELHTLTGLSPSSFRAARTKLAERGLVSLRRVAGGMYEYSLLNPETKQPWVRRIPRRKQADAGGEGEYKPILSNPPDNSGSPGMPMQF